MAKPVELNLDAPVHPGAVPALGLGDLLKWAPILEEVITAVEQAVAGGALVVPAIKFQVAGKHVVLGPCPLAVS